MFRSRRLESASTVVEELLQRSGVVTARQPVLISLLETSNQKLEEQPVEKRDTQRKSSLLSYKQSLIRTGVLR